MINIIILILILITYVTRDFFKILVCPEIPNSEPSDYKADTQPLYHRGT